MDFAKDRMRKSSASTHLLHPTKISMFPIISAFLRFHAFTHVKQRNKTHPDIFLYQYFFICGECLLSCYMLHILIPRLSENFSFAAFALHVFNNGSNFRHSFNPIQMGIFGAAHGWAPLPKICHTYPTMMKLGRVIPYLKKIQKIYESRDTLLEFC